MNRIEHAQRGGAYLSAARRVVTFLARELPLQLWAVTRTDGTTWTLLTVSENDWGVVDGFCAPWQESICSVMLRNRGPHVVPDLREVPEYAAQAVVSMLGLRAYSGVVLRAPGGEPVGTLCGVDQRATSADPAAQLRLLEFCAGMLDEVLEAELHRAEAAAEAREARLRAHADALTGLGNRASWLAALEIAEPTAEQPLAVLSVDVDGLKAVNDTRGHAEGDRLLMAAAVGLREGAPDALAVARVGGDEFMVLAEVADRTAATRLAKLVRRRMALRGVSAAVGCALWEESDRSAAVWAEADHEMYAQKRATPDRTVRLLRAGVDEKF